MFLNFPSKFHIYLSCAMADKKEPPFFNEDKFRSFHYNLPFYETMELVIETLTGTCFELWVSPFDTVGSVKAKIQRLEGIPIAQQHLIWRNVELEDECCLNEYRISGGSTLKLVLAMRGGPLNARRVTPEDPIREITETIDPVQEEIWEKPPSNKQVTFLVYHEGDQLNFFRVVEREDGALTPYSESLSGGSIYNLSTEDADEIEASPSGQQIIENSITMNKMKLLKSNMESMNLNKKPKKTLENLVPKLEPRPPMVQRPKSASVTSARHRLSRLLPHIDHTCLPCLPPGNPHATESSYNALSTLTATTRTIPSVTGDHVDDSSFPKTQQPKYFELGSLRPPTSYSPLRPPQVRNVTDPTFSRTTRFREVKVESLRKQCDVISKVDARDMTEFVNKASKEPVGSLNNFGFSASLARSTSRDHSGTSMPGRRRNVIAPPGNLPEKKICPPNDHLNIFITPHGLVDRKGCGKSTDESVPLFPSIQPVQNNKKPTKRCFLCGKKTGLVTSFDCRCGNNFCATHRYAETHSCDYDYKTSGRRYLQERNPPILAPKLPKI